MTGRYIVVFKQSASQEEIDKYAQDINSNGGEIKDRYDSIMKGFSATIPAQFLLQMQNSLQDGPIDYIEPDGVVTTQ
ncbi:protease propeptide/inhibitor [Heliocybe sulcata]|uniref:Protease propeptide/inhibitor n=1 Tax=Heliocybe sulcata TaxID=5364 RepID=A0A5C3NBE1_9AGAM|nr:protease propeptide/inhibitor [Heliocybe sulcata]